MLLAADDIGIRPRPSVWPKLHLGLFMVYDMHTLIRYAQKNRTTLNCMNFYRAELLVFRSSSSFSHSKYQRNSVQAEADSRMDRNAILIAERLLGRPIAC